MFGNFLGCFMANATYDTTKYLLSDSGTTTTNTAYNYNPYATNMPSETNEVKDKENVKDGLDIEYYENGKIKSIRKYECGLPIGYHIEYFPNGKVKNVDEYYYSDIPSQLFSRPIELHIITIFSYFGFSVLIANIAESNALLMTAFITFIILHILIFRKAFYFRFIHNESKMAQALKQKVKLQEV